MSRKKITMAKGLKQFAIERGYLINKQNFVKMKSFIGELTPGKSRSLAIIIMMKEEPAKVEMLLALTCPKIEKEKVIGGFNEANLLVKKEVDIDSTVLNMFKF